MGKPQCFTKTQEIIVYYNGEQGLEDIWGWIMKKRSAIAKALRSPHLKQQVIPDKRQKLREAAEDKEARESAEKNHGSCPG